MNPKLIKTEQYFLLIDEEGDVNVDDVIINLYDNSISVSKGWFKHDIHNTYIKPILSHLPINNSPKLEGVPELPPIEEKTSFSLEDVKKAIDMAKNGGKIKGFLYDFTVEQILQSLKPEPKDFRIEWEKDYSYKCSEPNEVCNCNGVGDKCEITTTHDLKITEGVLQGKWIF
jgi:hypothetical protein